MPKVEATRDQRSAPCASVVIPAYRNPGLGECLDALADADEGVSFDVTVLLNGATPEVARIARSHASRIAIVESPVNLGVSGGFNAGFAATRGDYLMQLQDDVVVEPGWLHHLVARAEGEPAAGAVGCLTLEADGTVMDPGHIVWNDGITQRGLIGGSTRPADYTESHAIDYHGSAGMLIRRQAWASIGGFDDEYYPAYYGDVDFCFRLRERGWLVLLEPQARVRHQGQMSTTTRFRSFIAECNRQRFLQRHGDVVAQRGTRTLDQSDLDREIAAARAQPAGPPPAPPTPEELAMLTTRLARDPLEILRRELDVRAEHAEQLEKELERVIADRDDAAAATQRTINELRSANDELATQNERLATQLATIDHQLQANQVWAADLERQLRELSASRSMRMTAPLRAALARIRRRS
jgi:GT2 family glycosyltransferase